MILPQKIIDEIGTYKESLSKFLGGELQDAFFRGIRVPWGFYSQRGGTFLMARLRIPGGILTPEQFQQIGIAAKYFSNEKLHITTRQDIQIHGVPYKNSIKIIEHLKDVNISPRGGGGNTIRNITGCYLSGICPKENTEVYKIVWGLTEYLLSLEESYNLPRKIKIAFSGCEQDCAYTGVNDIGVVALNHGFKVLCGGGMGANPAVGKVLHENIELTDIGYCIKSIINVFNNYGDRKNKHHNRLRFLIQDMGWGKFIDLYNQELNRVKETEYIVLKGDYSLPQLPKDSVTSHKPEIPLDDNTKHEYFLRHSINKQKQDGYCYINLNLAAGEIDCEALISLSELSNLIPTLIFRISQRQDVVISNVPYSKVSVVYKKLKTIIPECELPERLLDIVCCKGATTCNLGICNTPGLTFQVLDELRKIPLDIDKLQKMKININGCPNACGQHPIGTISFSGIARKVYNRAVPFYKLYLGGSIDAENTTFAEHIGIVPARVLPQVIVQFVSALQEREDSNLSQYIVNEGKLFMRELIARFSYVPPYEENSMYYTDFGKTEAFSLDGLSQGECGAGVIDMIESDLASAQQSLLKAQEKDFALSEIKDALIYSARALLVVKGVDPKDEREAIDCFINKVVHAGICTREFDSLQTMYEDIISNIAPKATAFNYTQKLYEEVKTIYSQMDSSFNFPIRFTEGPEQQEQLPHQKEALVYDLRGTPCPINYVKTKLKLEELGVGDLLEVYLDEGEPVQSVPRSLQNDGQEIVATIKEQGFYRVTIKKKT